MGKAIDWTGQKYHRLTFIAPTAQKAVDGRILWEAICDCGKTCIVIPGEVREGHRKSCGCLRIELSRAQAWILPKKARKYDPVISTARAVYKTYYTECEFDIFLKLTQQPCYYCGREPYTTYNAGRGYNSSEYQMQEGDFTYNGLDRVDPTKKHTSDNVVPCCIECNQAKNDLTVDEFFALVKMIYDKHIKPPT